MSTDDDNPPLSLRELFEILQAALQENEELRIENQKLRHKQEWVN